MRRFERVPTIFSKNKKNITIFYLKITIFTAMKNRSILHRCVIVMLSLQMEEVPVQCVVVGEERRITETIYEYFSKLSEK